MAEYTNDYLLNRQVKIFQPVDGYRASTDAVILSSLVQKVKKNDKILDVGSGTGAISLCLAARFQEIQPQITGIEIQPELAELSARSAEANGFSAFLHYVNADIRQKITAVPPCSFRHVITNPPYSDHDMPSPNPGKALAHNLQQFDLSSWLRFCLKMLAPKGLLYLINRAEAVTEIITALYGRTGGLKIIPLFSKPGQTAKRVMIIAEKDSKAPAAILPGLTVHTPEGGYTDEAFQILRGGRGFFELNG